MEEKIDGELFRRQVELFGMNRRSVSAIVGRNMRTISRWYKEGIPRNQWAYFLQQQKRMLKGDNPTA